MADEKAPVQVVKNCPACKKVLKKAKRYYRNGAYYCTKNCFQKFMETKAEEAREQEASNPKEEVKKEAKAEGAPVKEEAKKEAKKESAESKGEGNNEGKAESKASA